MTIASLLLVCVIAAFAVPVAVLLVQVLLAMGGHSRGVVCQDRNDSVAVLIPAHDEESVIGDTVAGLKSQLDGADRLLVVADNCADQTAAVARDAGAEVIERADEVNRGKGYALAYGVKHLREGPTDIVLVVDADCRLVAGAIDLLAAQAGQTGRPVQARYLMLSTEGASFKQRFGEFAWLLRNGVRPLGNSVLGLPCQLFGSGMAFPWAVIEKAPLANGSIVEDLKLGLDLARSGFAPSFCNGALVTSTFPVAEKAGQSQRKRWEHGHLGLILSEAPSLFLKGVFTLNPTLVMMALDLCVPPLALLALLLLGGLAAALIAVVSVGAGVAAAWVGGGAMLGLALAVLLAWHGWGRNIISLKELLLAPWYVVKKVPLYLAYLTNRQRDWIRTGRD